MKLIPKRISRDTPCQVDMLQRQNVRQTQDMPQYPHTLQILRMQHNLHTLHQNMPRQENTPRRAATTNHQLLRGKTIEGVKFHCHMLSTGSQ